MTTQTHTKVPYVCSQFSMLLFYPRYILIKMIAVFNLQFIDNCPFSKHLATY